MKLLLGMAIIAAIIAFALLVNRHEGGSDDN